jgi:hypothetical protein
MTALQGCDFSMVYESGQSFADSVIVFDRSQPLPMVSDRTQPLLIISRHLQSLPIVPNRPRRRPFSEGNKASKELAESD